ncbi:MAG: DMT family transporter [Lachnospiraceae bacterium]|nr:DMT family transporter [Lachnospiraceae bacterium]MDD7328054.1 DMT family transporter [Lachnospiraceae bacterium]MDY2760209.1 DMT family transporter [Lachnospiraceae bacterium]
MSELSTRHKHAIGISLVIADSFFFSLMTLFVRLSGDIPTMQKCFFRNAFAAVIAIIALARTDEKFHIKKGSLPGLFARSISGGLGMILNFYAIDRIGLADANILNKMSPFFAIIASIFILKEIPKKADWIAVIIAFVGAVFIIKPSANITSLYALAGLLGGLGAGIAYTFVRKLGQQGERGPVIVAFFSIFTCCLCLPSMIADFHPMSALQWLFLILAGLAAAGGQFTVTAAYKYAPAKNISVFDYSQVIFASIWGALVFNELPDYLSVIGYVIVISCAVGRWLYLMKSED